MHIRSVMRAAIATSAVTILASGLLTAASHAQTVTAVMNAPLRILDPITTTAGITRNHGFMVFDTLLGIDSNYAVKPQMADSWEQSADGKTFTFRLREGLKWHDGAAVNSEDCIASIKRWSEQNKIGQTVAEMTVEMKAVDDLTFKIVLSEPSTLLLEGLASISGIPAFMMPKRLAETPSTEAIGEQIGSGPFKFVADQFQPGVKSVYVKNTDYLPRQEPADWNSGGKVVHVDRVEWITMPDSLTAVNALLGGEIDYMEHVPYDLIPMFEGDDNAKIVSLDKVGSQLVYRFNHMHAPFDNSLLRQAAMYAIGQEDVMKAVVGNPDYYDTCTAVFGCGTPYEDTAGQEPLVKRDVEKAKALLKEGGYDGTPVVILHPSDNQLLSAPPLVIAQQLREAGFTVDLQSMDWQSVITRRASKEDPSKGGWSLLSTYITLVDIIDPVRNYVVVSNGSGAWFGWPDVPQIEELRQQFILSAAQDEKKGIANEIQRLTLQEGVIVPLGQFQTPSAFSVSLTEVLDSPVSFFWNLKKSEN